MKSFIFGLLLLGAAGELIADLPSNKSAEAPFAVSGKENSKVQEAVIKNNMITYGSRTVSFDDNGKITVMQSGKVLINISNSFKVKDGPFITTSGPNKIPYTVRPLKFENNTFLQEGKFDLPGNISAEFVQKTVLLPDGRLKLTMNLILPESAPADLLSDDSLFFGTPADLAYGKKAVITGKEGRKEFTIPETDSTSVVSDWRPNINEVKMFENTPFSFEILPLQYGWYSIRNYFKRTNLRLFPKRNSRFIECIIDLRHAPSAAESGKKYAGLDFRQLDGVDIYDRDLTRNMIPNPSFEQGSDCAMQVKFSGFEGSREKWEQDAFRLDPTVAKFGTTSLRLAAWATPESRCGDFRGIRKTGDVSTHPILLEPGKYVFSCYVKGNAEGQDLSVWVSRSCLKAEQKMSPSGDHYIAAGKNLHKVTGEWTRVEFPFEARLPYPATVNFNVTGKSGGFVWIDGLQLERGEKATAFVGRPVESQLTSSVADNVIEYGKDAKLKLKINSEQPGKADISVKNFFGDVVFNKNVAFRDNGTFLLNFSPDRGLYVVHTVYELADGTRTFDNHRFMVMTTTGNQYPNKNLFAVDYIALSSSPMFLRELERYQRLGYGSKTWMKQNFRHVDEAYKRFGFDISHGHVAECAPKRGGRHWIYSHSSTRRNLDTTPPLIRDYRDENADGKLTDDYIRRFQEAVKTHVKNHPWIKRWSFNGEDDAYMPDTAGVAASEAAFAQYVRLHLAFRDAVKAVDPNLQVVGGQIPCNTSPTGIPALERFLKAADGKGRYDLFAIHHYRESPEAPDLDADLTRLRAILTRYGYPDAMVMLPEGGQYGLYVVPQWELWFSQWNTTNEWVYGALGYDMGWYEKQVAARNMRTYLICLKNKNTSFVTLNPISGRTFSMDINQTPYAVQKAVNTLARLLGDAKFIEEVRFAPFVRAYLFEDGQGRPVAAIWNHNNRMDSGTLPYSVAAADFGKSPIEIFDMMEARRKGVFRNGKLEFAVSSYPIFLRGEKGAMNLFRKGLFEAEMIGNADYAPVELSIAPVGPETMRLDAVNLLSRPYQGKLNVDGKEIELKLAPSEQYNLPLRLPAPLRADRMTAERIKVQLGSNILEPNFEGILCRRFSGDSPDWKTIPQVPFTKRINPGKSKFSAVWQAAWNKDTLFVRVHVRDSQFVHTEYPRPEARWNNDSLQIYIDTLLNGRLKKTEGYDRDDYEYGIYPNSAGNKARVWRARQPDMQMTLGTATPPSHVFADDIPTTFTRTSDGYIYEVAFPAKYLLPIRMEKGTAFGFAMLLNDRNETKQAETHLTMAMDGKGCYNRPHAWPVLLLWD